MPNKTEIIWKAFSRRLRSYIRKRISDSTLAEDMLQEVFLKIHSKIDTLKAQANIRAWVYRVAQNTIIDYYRKRKIKLQNMDSVSTVEEQNHKSPAAEIAAGLKDMVTALPDKYAQALLLVEFQGLSQVELARKLGISLSGAKSRVQRARQMLKDSLMRCCHFQFDKFGTIIDFHPITCCCCHRNS